MVKNDWDKMNCARFTRWLRNDLEGSLYRVVFERNSEPAARAETLAPFAIPKSFTRAYCLTFDYLGGTKPYVTTNTRRIVLSAIPFGKW